MSSSQTHVEYLSQNLASLFGGLYYSSKKNDLYLNQRPAPYGMAFWALCKKSVGERGIFALARDNEKAYEDISASGQTCDNVRQAILKLKKDEFEAGGGDQDSKVDLSVTRFNENTPVLQDLLVIESPEGQGKRLYDQSTDTVFGYSNSVIDKTLERLLGKAGAASYLNNHTKQCTFTYEPFKERMYQENGHWSFNEYSHPEWRIGWTPDPKVTEPPKDINDFLSHLSPKPQEFLYPILAVILYARLTFAAILRGVPGCGKNIFVEGIVANLVGCDSPASNYTKATRGFSKSQFHDYLAKSRVAAWDEATIDGVLRGHIKDYLNTIGNFEGKHKKVTTPSSAHFSVFIMNNYKTDLKFDPDDRKFLVVPLRDEDLLDVKSQEWVDKFFQVTCKDKAVLQQLASYLHNCVKPLKRAVKTKQFKEICWLSKPYYFRAFIKMCVTHKEFNSDEYKKLIPEGFNPVTLKEKIQDHLAVYAQGNKISSGIGKFFDLPKGKWKFVSEIYGKKELLQFDDAYINAAAVTPNGAPLSAPGDDNQSYMLTEAQ